MKQIIKKTAAFLLSFSLIFSVFVFNFSALTPEKFVINECDSLEGWVGSNLQPTNDQAQACNSAAAISRNSNYGVFIGGYEPAEPIDISDYTYIEWDMMFMLNGDTTGAMWEQILAAYSSTGTNNTLFLRLSSNGNKSERAIWRSSAIEVTQPYANKNWFHFKAAIDNPNDAGTFDPAKMTEFYFTTCDAGETYFDKSIGSGVIRIDNIYATGLKEQPVVPGDANGDGVTDLLDLIRIKKYLAGTVSEISAGADMNSNGIVNNFDMVCLRKLLLGVDYTSDVEPVETVTITDCETEDGWTQESNNTGLELQPGRGVGGTGAIYAYGGYGALRKITYTLNTPIDLSGTATLEWDQYTVVQSGENLGMEQFETVYKAYKDYAAVAVSDGAVEVAFSVSKWQVGEPGEGNYRHIAVSLADSGLDLSNIVSVSFYTLPNGVGSPVTTVPSAIFRFDNIIATANTVTPNWSGSSSVPDDDNIPDVDISKCEDKTGWSYANGDNNIINGTNLGIDGTYVSVATGFGALRELKFTPTVPLDLTDTPSVEWDMVITETSNGLEYFYAAAEAYSASAGIKVSDGSNTVLVGVDEWEVGTPDANKWRHIAASLAGKGLNLSNIVSLTFVTCPVGQSADSTLSDNVIYRLDNIIATNNTVEPNWEGSGDNTGTAFMPSLFGNGMIFQQNKDMNLWGITDQPNESVEAKLYKSAQLVETQTAVSDSDGNWSLAFSPRKGSYDEYSISVSAGNQSKQISNVVIGELWIASGQSNMEFFLGNTVTDKSTIPLDEYIRVFKEPSVPTPDGANGVLSSVPVYDIVPDTNNANSIGKAVWTDASREIDIRYVSGVAYYTCLELREKLDVPVGFINTAKGASVIESWLSRESIDSNPTVKDKLEEKSLYMSERGLSAPKNWQYMTTLYNTKLAPIAGLDSENNKRSEHAGFNIAGVMWYQGESNIKYAEANGSNPFYTAALNQLIDDWSVIFGYEKGKMPFVVVDIAAYDYSNVRQSDYDYIIPMLSEAMSDACDAHAGTAVHIPIYDLPLTYMNPPKVDYHPIHPSNKQPVGERLAAAMLDRFYGEDSFAAPVFKEVAVSEGKLIITLDDVGTGIKIKNNGSVLYGFAICGADRVFVNADAKIISANQIEVSSPYVDSPVAATYAFSSYNASANLVSSFDIPCLPFRTDRVESVYLGVDDWMSADIEEVWSSSWKTLVGDMYDTWITSTSGASISFDTQIKASGTSSNHLNDYKYLAVTVKNDDNVQKTLKLQIGSGAYALTVDGKQGAELAAGSDFTTYVFDISQLVGLNGNTLSATMSNNAFAQDEITFILDTAGTVHIDEIRLATEI